MAKNSQFKAKKITLLEPRQSMQGAIYTSLAILLNNMLTGCASKADSQTSTTDKTSEDNDDNSNIVGVKSLVLSANEDSYKFEAFKIFIDEPTTSDITTDYQITYGQYSWQDQATIKENTTSSIVYLTPVDDEYNTGDRIVKLTLNNANNANGTIIINNSNNSAEINIMDNDNNDEPAYEQNKAPLVLLPVIENLTQPVDFDLISNVNGTDIIFIAQQNGIILRYSVNETGSFTKVTEYDLSDLFAGSLFDVDFRSQGLLGIAVNPDNMDQIFIQYSVVSEVDENQEFSKINTIIARYDIATTQLNKLLEIEDNEYHNGGQLQISNGNLYVAIGDGHTPYPEQDTIKTWLESNPAQDSNQLEGKLFYIPLDQITNTTIAENLASNIVATGLRNPWGFDFSDQGIILADVGWNSREEINFLPNNVLVNGGWPVYEGNSTVIGLQEISNNINQTQYDNMTYPIFSYTHNDLPAAVVGGVLLDQNSQQNTFLYADFMQPNISALTFSDDFSSIEQNTEFVISYQNEGISLVNPISFEKNASSDILLLDYAGTLYKAMIGEDLDTPDSTIKINIDEQPVYEFQLVDFSNDPTTQTIQIITLPEHGILQTHQAGLIEKTFTVKVKNSVYIIDEIEQDEINITAPGIYTFDQSDNTNSAHPLRFTSEPEQSVINNIENKLTTSVDNQALQNDTLIIRDDTEDFYYSCSVHKNMGASIHVNIASDVINELEENITVSADDIPKLAYFPGLDDTSFTYKVQDSDDNWGEIKTLVLDVE